MAELPCNMEMVRHHYSGIDKEPPRTVQPAYRVKHDHSIVSLREYLPSAGD